MIVPKIFASSGLGRAGDRSRSYFLEGRSYMDHTDNIVKALRPVPPIRLTIEVLRTAVKSIAKG